MAQNFLTKWSVVNGQWPYQFFQLWNKLQNLPPIWLKHQTLEDWRIPEAAKAQIKRKSKEYFPRSSVSTKMGITFKTYAPIIIFFCQTPMLPL